jgi:hypothetical protein
MMVRQTPHPAINAAATIANPDAFAVVPCEAMSQRKQNLVNTGHAAARPDNNRMPLPKEFIANLKRREVVRFGQSGPRASPLAPKKFDNQKMWVTSSFLFVRRST